jgi:hypothetical protein
MKILITAFMICLHVTYLSAQDCNSNIFFLDAIKNQFYYRDTIVVTLNGKQRNALSNGSNSSLQNVKCYRDELLKEYFINTVIKNRNELFNSIQSDSATKAQATTYWREDKSTYRCYSYLKSADNWYTLTFLTEGHYMPVLILINYNPQGKLNIGKAVFSNFIDAGDYEVTSSSLEGDILTISDIKKWEDNLKTITDSTATKYIVEPTGKLLKMDERKFKSGK